MGMRDITVTSKIVTGMTSSGPKMTNHMKIQECSSLRAHHMWLKSIQEWKLPNLGNKPQ